MIVLASASPRRQELLRNAAIPFTVQPADIDETALPGEPARIYAGRLAREKVLAVSRNRPQDYVLGADTVVVVDERILGKPRDADDAARMLRLLSGRTHQVITAVCLVGRLTGKPESISGVEDRELRTTSDSTLVTMGEISGDEIRDYIATGDPMDKAGAYGIQGMASRWVRRIEGDYSNVVGLPVARVFAMLREMRAI
jgi:septum formation protein